MKNYILDETLLPQVWLTWLSKDGRIWMGKDGQRKNKPESWMTYNDETDINRYRGGKEYPFGLTYYTMRKDKIWVSAGSNLMYAYAKYHADIDRLEIAAVKYDTTRGNHEHKWSYAGDRFFISKDKSVISPDGTTYTSFYARPGYSFDNVKNMLQVILRLNNNDYLIQEFKKFIGKDYFTIGNGTAVTIAYAHHIEKWYTSVQKTRSTGKAQQLTDRLVAMPLSNIDHLSSIYEPRKTTYLYACEEVIKNILYFERVNDEWSVLRGLIRKDNDQFEEGWRVYLGDDGTNRVVGKSVNEWIPASSPSTTYGVGRYYFANQDEAIEKCDRIKYILPMLNDNIDTNINKLINILKFPELEQLYKLGYQKVATGFASSSTIKADIKKRYGGYYNEKEKNLLRKIGMTKDQLNKCEAVLTSNGSYYRGHRVMAKMRETLGDDLSHIDNATFDRCLRGLDKILVNFYRDSLDLLDVDKSKFWKNLVRLNEKDSMVSRTVYDTINSYLGLNEETRPAIDWLFDSVSDVMRVHDAIVALKSEQDRERRAMWNMEEAKRRQKEDERRIEIDEKRKHYEYEDEDFVIRLPKNVLEIINEGSSQRICIGGYTTRHSLGETNLFFLRKKNEEDKPFYAIEMKNNNIVQIHGFGNRWLGNNPEAIPTVIRWLRKNGIKCTDAILTCKSTGYSSRNDYVPMPVVD